MERDTKLLKWAGWVFLAGIVITSIGVFQESAGRGDSAGFWFAVGFVLIFLSPVLLLMGAVNYYRRPRSSEAPSGERGEAAQDKADHRELIANWRRVVAAIVAVPAALIALGWMSLNGVLPELPSGPADSEFLRLAIVQLAAVLIIGGLVYQAVLAIDLRKIAHWLKEKR